MRAAFVGGSSGIGLATARLAVDAGWDVVILSRDPERADIDAVRVALDIADEAAVREAFAALGPVDHLVFSPVARAGGPAKSLDLGAARTAFETKFWGPFAAVQAAEVRESIVFVSGVAAATPMRGGSATAAVNGALEALVRTLAVELAPVRFNAIHPGIISDSPAWSEKKEAIANIEKRTPGGRLATTDDVVGAVDFLFTNRGVNGINLVIDGGWLLT